MKRLSMVWRFMFILLLVLLATISCKDPSGDFYVTGTIGGAQYFKSGYLLTTPIAGLTQIVAADSFAQYIAGTDDFWYITFSGNSEGTYLSSNQAVSVSFTLETGETYMVDPGADDVTVTVTQYSNDVITGTFSGTLIFSADSLTYAASGEFRVVPTY